MTVQERRERLLECMQTSVIRPKTAFNLVYHLSGYDSEHRCFDDLKVLEAEGKVRRLPGRPARWEAV